MVGEDYNRVIEPDIKQLRATLEDLGIAENTLIVAMADNGPMTHHPPPGAGLGEGLFRGGKGDFTEGGVRVCAAALWPGMIEPGQVAGDMIHETDLFTTFARLAGATEHIPTDRIIDGIDQTALLLKGDTHGRRDYNFIYQGPDLAATVKTSTRFTGLPMIPVRPSPASLPSYDLYNDHREVNPIVVGGFHMKEPFKRMRARHELWKKKYPDRAAQARPRLYRHLERAAGDDGLVQAAGGSKELPFDPLEFIKHLDQIPFDPSSEPGPGQ